ncbi:high affinity copper uptake protein 1-like isoform X2 [Argopecten irradians]|uniref:high affinity copper uptake protein 1-like isoform X2 n=1 Tax=Argopecten irradians TaxID=31199 RepID=UPI003711F889
MHPHEALIGYWTIILILRSRRSSVDIVIVSPKYSNEIMAVLLEENVTSPEDCGMPNMAMHFHTEHCQYILFEVLKTTTHGGLAVGCVCVFAFAFLYEGLKSFRDLCLQWLPYRDNNSVTPENKCRHRRDLFTYGHILQSILHMIQMLWSYSMMLIFMTYNTWLCAALILGAMLGYFVFGTSSRIQRDNFDHCH